MSIAAEIAEKSLRKVCLRNQKLRVLAVPMSGNLVFGTKKPSISNGLVGFETVEWE